ncbi:MAG: signal peptidase I [Luteolibacter sp.]
MFTPKWKKEAKHLLKGAKKFVDYKRDLLKPDRVAEIDSRRADLVAAIKSQDLGKVNEASKQLRAVCESSLPFEKPVGWLEENVEVMFVAIVIALGLRAYYLQPFRIPTGSMQPTLNGIIGTPTPEKEWPPLLTRMLEKATRGRTYVKIVADHDVQVQIGVSKVGKDYKYYTDLRDTQFMHFFSRSELHFVDGTTLQMPAPASPIYETGLSKALEKAAANNGLIPKGTVLCEGTIDSGDLVLVDKVSYHFRKPQRGEVFVFDTVGIEGTKKSAGAKPGTIKEQEDATHYIKRLAAVPGDTLSIAPPNVLINGKIAHEPGFENVYTLPNYGHPGVKGYSFASMGASPLPPVLAKAEQSLHLRLDAPVGMREYAALGDNSGNSLDSRYWGTVKEFNVVGPALFSLWPITTGHWGFIH